MSLIEEPFKLFTLSKLLNRHVTVHTESFSEPVDGILQSISEHGILIKNEAEKKYELFPWNIIVYIEHFYSEKDSTTQKQMEMIIEESPSTLITKNIPEDYEWEWYEDDEEAIISDDEEEEVIELNLLKKVTTVKTEKDFELAKKLSKALKINKIIKDLQIE